MPAYQTIPDNDDDLDYNLLEALSIDISRRLLDASFGVIAYCFGKLANAMQQCTAKFIDSAWSRIFGEQTSDEDYSVLILFLANLAQTYLAASGYSNDKLKFWFSDLLALIAKRNDTSNYYRKSTTQHKEKLRFIKAIQQHPYAIAAIIIKNHPKAPGQRIELAELRTKLKQNSNFIVDRFAHCSNIRFEMQNGEQQELQNLENTNNNLSKLQYTAMLMSWFSLLKTLLYNGEMDMTKSQVYTLLACTPWLSIAKTITDLCSANSRDIQNVAQNFAKLLLDKYEPELNNTNKLIGLDSTGLAEVPWELVKLLKKSDSNLHKRALTLYYEVQRKNEQLTLGDKTKLRLDEDWQQRVFSPSLSE